MTDRKEAFFNALIARGFKSVPTRQRVNFADGNGRSYAHKMVGTIEYQGMIDDVTYWISNDGHLRVGKTVQRCGAVVEDMVVALLVEGEYDAAEDLKDIEDDIEGLQTDPDPDPRWIQHELAVAEEDRRIARIVLNRG